MNCENELKIGDVVKSLDFVGVNDCYYIGRVYRILDDGRFCAETMKRVWEGEAVLDSSVSSIFAAPMQGQLIGDDRGIRVEVIE
jgi:hypothetical protein